MHHHCHCCDFLDYCGSCRCIYSDRAYSSHTIRRKYRYRSYGPRNTDRWYGEALFIILRNKNGYLNASKIEPRLILNLNLLIIWWCVGFHLSFYFKYNAHIDWSWTPNWIILLIVVRTITGHHISYHKLPLGFTHTVTFPLLRCYGFLYYELTSYIMSTNSPSDFM